MEKNFEDAFDLLMRKHAESEARFKALMQVTMTMARRMAKESPDPEQWVLLLTAALSEFAESFDTSDPLGQAAAAAVIEFQSQFEHGAISTL